MTSETYIAPIYNAIYIYIFFVTINQRVQSQRCFTVPNWTKEQTKIAHGV